MSTLKLEIVKEKVKSTPDFNIAGKMLSTIAYMKPLPFIENEVDDNHDTRNRILEATAVGAGAILVAATTTLVAPPVGALAGGAVLSLGASPAISSLATIATTSAINVGASTLTASAIKNVKNALPVRQYK